MSSLHITLHKIDALSTWRIYCSLLRCSSDNPRSMSHTVGVFEVMRGTYYFILYTSISPFDVVAFMRLPPLPILPFRYVFDCLLIDISIS